MCSTPHRVAGAAGRVSRRRAAEGWCPRRASGRRPRARYPRAGLYALSGAPEGIFVRMDELRACTPPGWVPSRASRRVPPAGFRPSHTQRAGHAGMRPRVGPLLARNPANGCTCPRAIGWLTRVGSGHATPVTRAGDAHSVTRNGCPSPAPWLPSGVRGRVFRRVTCGVTLGGEPPSRTSDAPLGTPSMRVAHRLRARVG